MYSGSSSIISLGMRFPIITGCAAGIACVVGATDPPPIDPNLPKVEMVCPIKGPVKVKNNRALTTTLTSLGCKVMG